MVGVTGILLSFLVYHSGVVIDGCISEFDEKKFEDDIREEGREEGRMRERRNSIQIMIELNVDKDEIIKRYSREEYEEVVKAMQR